MKRVIAILLAGLLLAGLGSCAKKAGDAETSLGEIAEITPVSLSETPSEIEQKTKNPLSLAYFAAEPLNPYACENSYNLLVSGLIYEGLFARGSDFSAAPCLCESWESEDHVNWTFELKRGVTFHNGRALTAADVVYSLELSGRVSGEIWAEGDHSVKISLYSANPRLPMLLDAPVIPFNTGASKNPRGTGPYMLGAGQLERYSGYRKSGDIPETIDLYNVKNAGEIVEGLRLGGVTLTRGELAGSLLDKCERWNYPTSVMHYLILNTDSGYCSDARMRHVLSYAVDRESIVSGIFPGKAAASVLPLSPFFPEYDAELANFYEFSPENVKNALEAMYAKDENDDGWWDLQGWNVELRLIVNAENEAKTAAARAVAEGLIALGLRTEVRELPWEEYLTALAEKDFDICYAEVRLAPDFDLAPLLVGSLNYGAFSLSDISLTDYAAILDRAPFITILFEMDSLLLRRETAMGLDPADGNTFNNFFDWKFD